MNIRLETRPLVARCLAAALFVAAGFLLQVLSLGEIGAHYPYLFLYGAVMLSALFCGLVPGMLATALAGIVAIYFFIEPIFSFAMPSHYDQNDFEIFTLMSVLITLCCDAMRRYRIGLQRKSEELSAMTGSLEQEIRDREKTEESLRVSEDQLQKAKLELESRVRDRTLALNAEVGIRRAAELALAEREEILRQLVDNVAGVFFLRDADSREFRFISPKLAQDWGIAPDRLLEHVHPEDRDKVRAMQEEGRTGHFDLEYRLTAPDGPVRWVHGRSYPVRDPEGRVYRVAGLLEDITGRKDMEARLHELSARLAQGREQERLSLSRELHDSTIQTVTAIKLEADTLATEVLEGGAPAGPERLLHIRDMAGEAVEELRRVIADLRPPVLDDLGFVSAVRWLVQKTREASRGTALTLTLSPGIALPPDMSIALFRVLQAALGNVLRHARATKATVRVSAGKGRLALTVRDNGRGFDPEGVPAECLGLAGMRERMELLGGTFAVESAPGKGAVVRAEAPLPATRREE